MATRWAILGVLAIAAACAYTGPVRSPAMDYTFAGRYPAACSWLRVDAEGNRRRTERTFDGPRLMTEVTYDESGRPRLVRSQRFVYDEYGRQIRVDAIDVAERRSRETSYDARGRWVATEDDVTGRRDERYYDEAGRVTARRVVSTDGTVLQLHTFERDGAGEIVSERIDFPTEGRTERINLSRPADGTLERHIRRASPNTLEQRDVYTFTPSGDLATMTRYGDVRLTQHYRRDDDGNLLRVDTWDEDGDPIAATVYDYSCWRR